MKLHELMTRPSYPKMKPGNHSIVLLHHDIKAATNGDDYLNVAFAPSDNLLNVHHTALFANEDASKCQVTRFTNNLQNSFNMPGATLVELLAHAEASHQEIPASYDINIVEDKTYYNWSLGWARPTSATPDPADTPADETPAPPARKTRA